ncbi:hypothetical protein HQO84_26355 [Rhodococcus fascians]|nr:hypothetical protein [Rhodococcus fascians]MBY3999989.1 hypothetical protein [Rhodococcus fascians]MBY4005172.1 hypothetical protein [Rhodococcus fascians]MBY4010336.1 hypothetical protein [Rhodococcus fascians]MBY4020379.1 hypothetical protein [Rhodococcus fascians]
MPNIAAGHHLYPVDDGTWLCSRPGDRFVRLSGPPHVVKLLQESAHTGSAIDVDSLGDDAGLARQLIALLDERGILEQGQAVSAPASRVSSVLVDGDTPIAEAVAGLIEDCGDVTVGIADEGAVSAADVVVSCATWLPDARWAELQNWCTTYRTVWHRCHSEGDRFFVGPLWSPTSTNADYHDVRGRRLAASGVADHLLDHWRYLDDPTSILPPVRWPHRAGIAVVAGCIASEVRAYLTTGDTAIGSVQLEVDPASANIVHHPVLPIPFRRGTAAR